MSTREQHVISWSEAIDGASALLCLVMGFASLGHAASAAPQNLAVCSAQTSSQFAIADFDGDNLPDLATVETGQSNSTSTRYWIAFQLSSGSRRTLGITAPSGGLHLVSRDVNGDSFLDVVVTTAWVNRPVAVLVNDGHGNFTQADPSAFPNAFRRSGTTCIGMTVQIKDVAAALAPRGPAGNCQQGHSFSLLRDLTALRLQRACRNALRPASSPFFGRAPPPINIHS